MFTEPRIILYFILLIRAMKQPEAFFISSQALDHPNKPAKPELVEVVGIRLNARSSYSHTPILPYSHTPILPNHGIILVIYGCTFILLLSLDD